MIIEEVYSVGEDGTKLIRRYSDDPTKVLQQVETGDVYDEAIDLETTVITYVEVDKPDEMQQASNGE